MNDSTRVPGLQKLLDYAASGIGGVAGSLLSACKPTEENVDKLIVDDKTPDSPDLYAQARARARDTFMSEDSGEDAERDSGGTDTPIAQRLDFQERRRQRNIESIVRLAVAHLGDQEAEDGTPDHDWAVRFFACAQDVSSNEMQALWARVLATEVMRAGSTCIHTLSVLDRLDRATVSLFRKLCSACMFLIPDGKTLLDVRLPVLSGNEAIHRSLQESGIGMNSLGRLNDLGLLIPDRSLGMDYRLSVGTVAENTRKMVRIPFRFQDRYWILVPRGKRDPDEVVKVPGIGLSISGKELSHCLDVESMERVTEGLTEFFRTKHNLDMVETSNPGPQLLDMPS